MRYEDMDDSRLDNKGQMYVLQHSALQDDKAVSTIFMSAADQSWPLVYKSRPKLLWNADRGSGISYTSMAVIRHVSRAILLMISNLNEYRSTLKLSKVIKAIFQ